MLLHFTCQSERGSVQIGVRRAPSTSVTAMMLASISIKYLSRHKHGIYRIYLHRREIVSSYPNTQTPARNTTG